MSVHYTATEAWHNAVEYNSEIPSIVQNSISTSAVQQNLNEFNVPSEDDKGLKELPFDSVKIGQCVKVLYKEELFIGKITNLCRENGYKVRCLNLPYSIAGHGSEFECDSDKCYYDKVYLTTVKPENVKVG